MLQQAQYVLSTSGQEHTDQRTDNIDMHRVPKKGRELPTTEITHIVVGRESHEIKELSGIQETAQTHREDLSLSAPRQSAVHRRCETE